MISSRALATVNWRKIGASSAIVALILLVNTAIFFAAQQYLLQAAQISSTQILGSLLPAIRRTPGTAPFKADLIIYGLFQFLACATLGLFWLWRLLQRQNRSLYSLEKIRQGPVLRFPVLPNFQELPRGFRVLFPVVIVLTLVALAAPMFVTWYPPIIPNDYYEVSETAKIQIHGKPLAIDHMQLVRCVAAQSQSGACPASAQAILAENPTLLRSLRDWSLWQSELGRTYFHHSYVLVPAAHFLKYGLDRSVPYLYGYGNTISQALVMAMMGGVSVTHYFLALPWMEFLSLLSIAALAGYIARSWLAAAAALVAGLFEFYSITYVAIFLAASFNPDRYIGLVIQIASMVFVFRGNSQRRIFAMPIAAAISCFWNGEFAVMGMMGQLLVMVSPNLAISMPRRIAMLVLTALAVAIGFYLLRPNADIIGSVWLGFYNIGLPDFLPGRFAPEFTEVIAIEGGLFCLILSTFSGAERDVRIGTLALLSLVLVKWVFNPSPVNVSFSLILILPLALTYLPWDRWKFTPDNLGQQLSSYARLLACGLIFAYCVREIKGEFRAATDFKQDLAGYVAAPWKGLGETLPVLTPEAPIAERINATRSELRPGDKVLFLSPFDQVMSFYVNPASYCGHFEVLSNLLTVSMVKSISSCVSHSANMLIVTDTATDIPCQTAKYDMLGKDDVMTLAKNTCAMKETMKKNLNLLFADLPKMKQVGERGPLRFYRPL